MPHTAPLSSTTKVLRKLLMLSQFLMAAAALSIYPAYAEEPAGKTTLVIGKAYVIKGDSSKAELRSGSDIFSGDQIITRSNGHVHIRFKDQGLVSVRPDSKLVIEQYEFDANNPSNSTIKLDLKKGIARSVSGAAAKAAKERYRMNTPIAAIGVRGTDFVVSANDNHIRAIVNEGAIVVAPFSDQCVAATLGPCTSNAVELTENSNLLLELKNLQQTPQLLPIRGEITPEIPNNEQPSDNRSSRAEQSSLYNESIASKTLSDQLAKETDSTPPESELPPQTPDLTPELPDFTPELPNFTPDQPVATETLKSRQLVWGRWNDQLPAGDTITMPYQEASEERNITVGNNEYALFRTDTGNQRVDAGITEVNFALNSAQASFTSALGTEAMDVTDGTLGINFTTNQFSTSLDLTSSATGDVSFSTSGRVYDGGFFNSRSDTHRLGGAVSLDGEEAGYFFNQQLNDGNISGITLWDSK